MPQAAQQLPRYPQGIAHRPVVAARIVVKIERFNGHLNHGHSQTVRQYEHIELVFITFAAQRTQRFEHGRRDTAQPGLRVFQINVVQKLHGPRGDTVPHHAAPGCPFSEGAAAQHQRAGAFPALLRNAHDVPDRVLSVAIGGNDALQPPLCAQPLKSRFERRPFAAVMLMPQHAAARYALRLVKPGAAGAVAPVVDDEDAAVKRTAQAAHILRQRLYRLISGDDNAEIRLQTFTPPLRPAFVWQGRRWRTAYRTTPAIQRRAPMPDAQPSVRAERCAS